jgi:hypothetical protein
VGAGAAFGAPRGTVEIGSTALCGGPTIGRADVGSRGAADCVICAGGAMTGADVGRGGGSLVSTSKVLGSG